MQVSAVTKSATLLKGLGYPRGSFLVIDPGKRTGYNIVSPVLHRGAPGEYPLHTVGTCALDELPTLLAALMRANDVCFVVCEDYSLLGGSRRNDPKMPSSQGIGMCKTACAWTDTTLYLIQPNHKAPAAWQKPADTAARERCRNDHQRDVVDLAITVLRYLEKPA